VKHPGRIRSAWSVLMGERMVSLQIQGEWAEYQQVFEDILTKFSAMLARQAKSEKKRIEALIPTEEVTAAVHGGRRSKAELRSLAAGLRGIGPSPQMHVEPPQEEQAS